MAWRITQPSCYDLGMTTAAPQAPKVSTCTCVDGLVTIPGPDGPWQSACTNKACKESAR